MNVTLLRKIKKHILEEPKRLAMDYTLLIKPDRYGIPKARMPKCGTIGCIAGWACVLSGMTPEVADKLPEGLIYKKAREVLRLTEEEGFRLFLDYEKDSKRTYFSDTRGTKEEAELIGKRIDLFIRTKGRE